MNATFRTLVFVAVAAASSLFAFTAWKSSQPSPVAGFGDVGQEFFPDFDDVAKVSALTVVDYDEDEKDVLTFSVREGDNGLWVIPSHHNYPAEAEDRLARTATSLLAIKKLAVKSRSEADWKRFGVVDPAAESAATADERGTRLTLADGSGNPVVDLIVGSEVEGQENHYHVREPDKKTTYIAELNVDLSAKFSDWIEPDLLKISSGDVVRVILDNYSIDEQRGRVEKKELLEFVKVDLSSTGDWTLADLNAEKEELDQSPVRSIATSLDQLKIVGVRPKPEGLDDNLRVNPVVRQILESQMQAQGYFIGGDADGNERLYSNEGELIAGINNGVEYTLYFGEIARGSGKEIEVGLAGDAKTDDASDESGDEEGDGPRRYLLVKVDFNEELLGAKPVAPTEPEKPEILNESPTDENPEEDTAAQGSASSDDTTTSDADDSAAEESAADSDADADDPEVGSAEDVPSSNDEEPSAVSDSANAAQPSDAGDAADGPTTTDETTETPDPAATEAANASDETAEEPSATDESVAEENDPATADEPQADPREEAQKAYDLMVTAYEKAKKKFESDLEEYEKKVREGQEQAEELALRFSGWYYVISSNSFEKFRVERKDVVSLKETETEGEEDAGDSGSEGQP